MLRAVMLMLCAASCLAAQPAPEAIKKELKSFQGTWKLVGGQDGTGKPYDEETLKNMVMIVDGNKFTIKDKGADSIVGTFTIDPTKKIKTIDIAVTKPIDTKMLGIYQSEGDTRKSCFADPGKDRPDGFRKNAGFTMFEWKRVK